MKNPVKHLHAPDVSMLFPYKGNLHEFFAGPNGAAVLDILLPPYDANHDRDCTFYDVQEDPAPMRQDNNNMMMMDVDPSQLHSAVLNPNEPSPSHSGHMNDDDDRVPCWIIPTCQPHDFHCLSGKYKKLGTHVIAMQDG